MPQSIQQPMRMPVMQQPNQKRSLNKARSKLIKSSRFWGKRTDNTLHDENAAAIFDNTNSDRPDKQSDRQKFDLTMSSSFWG
ncbi:unnamed protein product [Onchocerca flexuosa]|uniref:Uncharacterized protein n=1 Tax=Onchocerca flexuosa TaxID=387005 RepID=A0A183HG67_9BILA|nr:unnamed protein product [Onchocerca flexuosa]